MNNFTEVKVSPTWHGFNETNCTFDRPTMKRKYIRILALCLNFTPISLIYPNVKNPIQKQIRDLCRQGYLARYQADDNRYYYKTTTKGQRLLARAVEAN